MLPASICLNNKITKAKDVISFASSSVFLAAASLVGVAEVFQLTAHKIEKKKGKVVIQ